MITTKYGQEIAIKVERTEVAVGGVSTPAIRASEFILANGVPASC